jgi:signal transduction histidine kinase
MKFGGLSWKFLGGMALVVALALSVSFWLFAAEVERLRDEELTDQLLGEARLLALALQPGWGTRDVRPVAGMVSALHNEGTDVVVMAADGTDLVNTIGAGPLIADFLQQPETRGALMRGSASATRRGIHGPAPTRLVAVRLGSDADELGVVWLARPCWTFVTHARSFGPALALVAVIALATVVGLGAAVTRRWAGLLRRMTSAAHRLAEGDLSARAEAVGSDEFALLARALNEMRQRLRTHAETIDRQRRTLECLLDQLHEGVIAASGEGRIILVNATALRLLDLDSPAAGAAELVGQAIEQCLPQHELQRLLRVPAGAAAQPVQEGHVRVETPAGVVHLLARASDLRLPAPANPASAAAAGRLVVLTDVTALRRALDMQTDFVANASHELRTPLASVRAAVETLLQMDGVKQSVEATRFVEVIDRQSARLTALATDLLNLSRIQSPAASLAAALPLDTLLRELTERFAEAVRAKGLRWEVDWQPGERRTVTAQGHLLRLVLDNLMDNAVQFTEPGGQVRVVCRAAAEQVVFEVADTGCGIPEPDQPRVFERFYQVERARSGARHGTGLGLSIVRDAVTALGGTVRLESQVGVGTRVTVTLPQPK